MTASTAAQPGAPTLSGLQATIASLEEQLIALYAEKQVGSWTPEDGSSSDLQQELAELRRAFLAGGGQGSSAAMQATIEGLEQQLAALYDERSTGGDLAGLAETAANLEAQVAALLEERNDLARILGRARTRIVDLLAKQVDREFAG